MNFAVIGAGRLGASLALALRAHGLSLSGFTAQTAAGRKRAEGWLGGQALSRIDDAVSLSPDVYFISVPDEALPRVAAELGASLASQGKASPASPDPGTPAASTGVSAPFVAHTSGATTVSVLLPCEQAGASTFVFHPLQTFADPIAGQSRFAGAAVAVTPFHSDPQARAALIGHALAQTLGGRPFFLADDKRALYHAAATLACNYFVALEHHSRDLFVQAGLPPDEAFSLFLPLVRATLESMETLGTLAALTGPLSRGDADTVHDHLTALASDAPHLLPVYRALAFSALDMVRDRGEIDPRVIDQLTRLLRPVHGHDSGPAPHSHAAEG